MLRQSISLQRIVCAVCVGVVLSGEALFAQDDDAEAAAHAVEAARQAAEAQRIAEEEEDRQMRERSIQMMREFLNDTPNSRQPWNAGQDRRRRFQEFRDAFRGFEVSRQELSRISTEGQNVSGARKLEETTKKMLEFVKLINKKHLRLDASEFKNLSNGDLLQEIVATAARIVPSLTDVIRNEGESVVDIKFLTSLPQLELDLLRLQWMTRRLK